MLICVCECRRTSAYRRTHTGQKRVLGVCCHWPWIWGSLSAKLAAVSPGNALSPVTWPCVSTETQLQARAGIQTPGLHACPALSSWVTSLASVYYLFVYFERVFCSTGWPRTCCVVMDDIESVIVLDFTHCGYRTAGFMYARQASYQPSYILSPIFFSCLNLFS